MIFLLRKPWTRNWVKCVSLPAEVAKPRGLQLCARCFRGWGTPCAAEELTDVLGGFPGLQDGTELSLAGSSLPQALGGDSWQNPAPGSVREHRELCLPRVCILPFPLWPQLLWPGVFPLGFPELSPLQRFAVLRSSARCSCASLFESLLLFMQIKHVTKCNHRFLSINGILTSGSVGLWK